MFLWSGKGRDHGKCKSAQSLVTLETHEKDGVKYVEFYASTDNTYLLTCGDDRTVKVWNRHGKSYVQTLETTSPSHSFTPTSLLLLLLIISSSEVGTIKIWNSETYRLKTMLS